MNIDKNRFIGDDLQTIFNGCDPWSFEVGRKMLKK